MLIDSAVSGSIVLSVQIIPERPAVPSLCPKHDLFDISVTAVAVLFRVAKAPERAPSSIGSPRGVPVPCIDTVETSNCVARAAANADLDIAVHRCEKWQE